MLKFISRYYCVLPKKNPNQNVIHNIFANPTLFRSTGSLPFFIPSYKYDNHFIHQTKCIEKLMISEIIVREYTQHRGEIAYSCVVGLYHE